MNKFPNLNKKLLSQYSTPNLKVYTVNQTAVCRDNIAFVGGGHDLVYSFIPSKEIWIAENLPPIERKYFVYHELYERRKMSMGLDYDTSHNMANVVEIKARNSKETELDKMIRQEMERVTLSERSHFNGTLNLHKDGALHHTHHKNISRPEPKRLAVINVYAK